MQNISRIIMTTSLLSGLLSSTFAGENSPPTGALKVTATVNVNLQAKERSVTPSFLGLSMVLSETPYMVGTCTSPNPHFRQLLGNLLAYSNGPMEIRELNDKAFGPTTIPDHLPALANLYRDMQSPQHGVKYFMGVDFSGNFDAQGNENGIAASQAESFRSLLPQGSVLSYEIGNEPDLYNAEHSRSNYTYAKYKLQYEQTVAAIESKGTGVPMAAPVFSGYPGGFMRVSTISLRPSMHTWVCSTCTTTEEATATARSCRQTISCQVRRSTTGHPLRVLTGWAATLPL
ncbi:hypothetical protein R69619_04671 [Paraburkholderia nemoris]|uniref:hypothetical protein n=1 Tax=Paraburkholderia nemoris TaxID=2793076 RepID=UPI00190C49AC|nr:hypothetical protein [Paraburkholderia nemoris]MBK3742495.1 hypothetical protein [Paraburkholderia aspalathi]CAE6789116.1 hypothetical protein R69619_04671 [Paraburkholderia nemoris]